MRLTTLRPFLLVTSAIFAVPSCAPDGGGDGKAATAPRGSVSDIGVPADLATYLDCIDDAGRTIVSAHRGGPSAGYPENALETLTRTVEQTGVNLLEVDIRTSADGVLFLHHDDDLDRSTSGKGTIADTEWATLRSITLRDESGELTAYRLARFDDVLRWAENRAILQLDIKPGTDYDDVALAVRSAAADNRVMPIAYTQGQAVALARKFPNSIISAPVTSMDDLATLNDRGLSDRRLFAWTGIETLDPALYDQLDAKGVEVAFGTLGGRDSIDAQIERTGDDSRYADIARQGVDIIATDRPAEAKIALEDAGLWPSAGECIAR